MLTVANEASDFLRYTSAVSTPSRQTNAPRAANLLAPYGVAMAALGLACSLFGFMGTLALLLFGWAAPEADAAQDVTGLLVRLAGFPVVGFLFTLAVYRLSPLMSVPRSQDVHPIRNTAAPEPFLKTRLTLFLVGMALAAFVSLWHLNDYPWAAPDETHHLTVVRNLAEHGVYASGHPDGELKYFDPYDSVGAPVIFAGAFAWRMTDSGLAAPRAIVGLHFLGLLLCLAWLLRGEPWAAALVPLLATGAYSTVYLSRTFYGEVPALFYLVAGVCAWTLARRALRYPLLLMAGVLFGLAVLCKPIFATLGCCGLVAVGLHAWMQHRRESNPVTLLQRGTELVALGAGAFLPLLAWVAFQQLRTPEGYVESRSMAGIYQHYLLFGIEPILGNLQRLWNDHPAADLIAAVVFVWWGGSLVARGAHPGILLLWMAGGFFAWWWLCYTPGQLLRYLWPAYFMAAVGAAAAVPRLGSAHALPLPDGLHRLRDLLIVAVLFYPGQWLLGQVEEVRHNREMREFDAVLEAVRALPPDARIASPDYPLRGILNVLTNRPIGEGEDVVSLFDNYDVLVLSRQEEVAALQNFPHDVQAADPYWIVSKPKDH